MPDKQGYETGLLLPVGNFTPTQHLAIYADAVVVFSKPETQDLVMIIELLVAFGKASRLHVNYLKTSATIIRGGE